MLIGICCFLYSFGQNTSQTCEGSLGDPVFTVDFGSGPSPGPPLISGLTTMIYTSDNCPNDNYYTIASSIQGAGNCHQGIWHNVTSDHTGNPNGYMMIVNATQTPDNKPSVFYTQPIPPSALCPNTKYQFSAYVLNLLIKSATPANYSEPNIVFSIETTAGVVLKSDTTGTIDPSDSIDWNFKSVFFTTPADVSNIVVRMINLAPGGNGNDLILDDISFKACGPTIQTGVGTIGGQQTANFCMGDNQKATLKAYADGNPIYQWQQYNADGTWTDITGENAATYTRPANNAIAGTYLYRVGVVANGGDITAVTCRTYSAPMAVVVNPPPNVPAFAAQTLCEGATLTLTATGGYTYTWTGPNMAPSTQNPLVINNVTMANAGTYTVTPKSSSDCDGAPVSAQVTIEPKVVASVGSIQPICSGQSVQLSASGGLYYKWTPSTGLDHDDIASPMANPQVTTTYSVNVSNDGCNDDSKSVTVNVIQTPVADGGGDKKIFEGQSVKLNGGETGDGVTSISWSPTTALDDPSSLTPIASPTDDITYTLTVTSGDCGIATSTVFVRVYKKITIPNTFSPNNDGVNDLWNIEALFTYPESLTQVFNRYGKRVFQSTGYSKAWDGTYNGSPLPGGTYYYIIDLKNNTPKLSGWLVMLK